MARADLSALSIFASVAARRSFRAAARDLGLSPSAVSHAVGGLEAKLGVRLLARTTRSVAPTEAGQKLLSQLQPALAEIEGAVAATSESRASPSGVLRLTVPRSSGHHLLVPRLRAFNRAFPDVTVEIQAEDRLVDIVESGFDAGIRFGESLEQDMIAVRFGPEQRMVAVASPAFLAERAPPLHPRDLVAFPCIAMRFPRGTLYRWEFDKDGEAIEVAVKGPLILNDNRLVLDAAIAGLGLGFVLEGMAAAALARGDVVRVLDDWCQPFPGFFLYYPSRRQLRPALRAFIDFFTRGGIDPSSAFRSPSPARGEGDNDDGQPLLPLREKVARNAG